MKQKDIYLANLSPVVIVSGDTMNKYFDLVMICPISSKIKNFASCVGLEKSKSNGLKDDSEIITFQMRTISKTRLGKRIGKVSGDELKRVLAGLYCVLKY